MATTRRHEYVLFNQLEAIEASINTLNSSFKQGLAGVKNINTITREKARNILHLRTTARLLVPEIQSLRSYFYEHEEKAIELKAKPLKAKPKLKSKPLKISKPKKVRAAPRKVIKTTTSARKQKLSDLKRDLKALKAELRAMKK